jgi:ATP adenylyltransferase
MPRFINAPWRIGYILGKKEKGCVFCRIAKETKKDGKNFVLRRGKRTFTILNLYPYNNGHLMVIPYQHTSDLSDLDAATTAEMMEEIKYWTTRMKPVMKTDGFNVGMNLGRGAGAGIAEHLHCHIVPRWIGDSNFMPVIGDVKVLPISLKAMYKTLRKG